MEITELYKGLTFLAYTSGVVFIVVGLMLTVVLFNMAKLTKNIDETAVMIKTELEPTLKNVRQSVEIVSGVIIKTNDGINKAKEFLSKTPLKLLGQFTRLTGKATKGFFSGLCSAYKMFSKK
ncbi:hypothetical protein IJO12_00230 [bacterium]|nr:hypothetical protein [bacterium]